MPGRRPDPTDRVPLEEIWERMEGVADAFEILAHRLRALTRALAAAQKVAPPEADKGPKGEATSPPAAETERLDALVEEQFRRLFEAPEETPPAEAAEERLPETETVGSAEETRDATEAESEGSPAAPSLAPSSGDATVAGDSSETGVDATPSPPESQEREAQRAALSEGTVSRPAPPVGEPPPRRVLVVSASRVVRRFLARHLEDLGMEVLEGEPGRVPRAGQLLGLFVDEELERSPELPGGPRVLLGGPGPAPRDRRGTYLERPFARERVEEVLAWMRRQWQAEGVKHAGARTTSPESPGKGHADAGGLGPRGGSGTAGPGAPPVGPA
jgi:hypothetical protein